MQLRKNLGNKGEEAVANYLLKRGFKIIGRNYNTKVGEIDLIVQKEETLAFVEVKTRKNVYFPISNVVTFSKQKKIIKTAKLFISKNNIVDKVCRFDVATVECINGDYQIKYIPNAFYGH